MKAKTFENLIRKVVREEIDYSLRREIKSLKEDLRDELKPTIVEHTEKVVETPINPMPETSKTALREKIMGSNPIPKKPVVKQNFTTNSALNDLLNETAQGSINLESSNPTPMETTRMPKEVDDAVTRDYSGLMKAIDKKKGK